MKQIPLLYRISLLIMAAILIILPLLFIVDNSEKTIVQEHDTYLIKGISSQIEPAIVFFAPESTGRHGFGGTRGSDLPINIEEPEDPEEPPIEIEGCMDTTALNYDPDATIDNSSCEYAPVEIEGCTNPDAPNYDPDANVDDGSCEPIPPIEGCTDSEASNYNPEATLDDDSCTYPPLEISGCTDPAAINYNEEATIDDDSCVVLPEPTDFIITPENFKVAFFGDGRLGGNYETVLQLVEDEGVDLVIHSGDIVNSDRDGYPQRWFNLMSSILDDDGPFPYVYSIGNHDDEDWLSRTGDDGEWHIGWLELQQNRFAELGWSYTGHPDELGAKTSFEYQGLFVTLTAPGFEREEPGQDFTGDNHAEFLRQELSNSNHLWQICSWHKLMEEMQVGGKGDETGWQVYEACRENGALIANGHEHSYARTHVLSSMAWQIVADDVSPYIIQPGQTMTWHAGLGGQDARDQHRCFGDSCDEWATIYTKDQGATNGALFIEFHVDGDPRKARGYFMNIRGEKIDEFELYNRRGMEEEAEVPEGPGEGFVYAHDGELYLDGEEYTFVGVNAYGAANNEYYSCGPHADYGDESDAYLDSLFSTLSEEGINAVRLWAFQAFADHGRDFSTFDRVFHYANQYDMKVIPTLENQWEHCPGDFDKYSDWYQSGYNTLYSDNTLTFPQYVTEMVTRYQDEPAILMWQIMNEAESESCTFDADGDEIDCENEPEILLDFAIEISNIIKSIDSNHLVNFGTMGSGQPGTANEAFFNLHNLETIDVIEAHDYEGDEPMPEDIGESLALANALGKPFFIGEAGLGADSDDASDMLERAELFDAKIGAHFDQGGDGYLIWEWRNPEYDRDCGGGYSFCAYDPLVDVLGSH